MRPHSGTVLYMEGPGLNHLYWGHHSNKIRKLPGCNFRPPISSLYSKWLFPYFLHVNSPKIADPSPIKKLFYKIESSIQTYVNYHKTHAMATHYSGMGDTSMENTESQDVDSDSQDNYQEENIILLQHLTHKMEWLRQTVEDRDNDPRDALQHLEQKLNQLAITLCPLQTPLRKYCTNIQTLCVTLRRKHL